MGKKYIYLLLCSDFDIDPELYATHEEAEESMKIYDEESDAPCGPHRIVRMEVPLWI